MGCVSKLLDDSVVEVAKKSLKTRGKSALLARKLQAVIAAKEHGISQVALIYGISRTTLTSWIKHIKSGELNKLEAPPERKRKNKLGDEQRQKIAKWIEEDSQLTIMEVKLKIEKEFELIIGKSTVHRELKKMGLSYITPRPKHFKQDETQVAEFKKKYSK
jgi:transposase